MGKKWAGNSVGIDHSERHDVGHGWAFDPVRDIVQVVLEQSCVEIERHGGRRVSEHPLYCLHVRADRDRDRRRRVPQIVRSDAGESSVDDCLIEPIAARILVLKDATCRSGGQEIVRPLARGALGDSLGEPCRYRHRAGGVSLGSAPIQ